MLFIGLFTTAAQAAVDFTLSQNQCCARVEVTQISQTEVKVVATTQSGLFFVNANKGINHIGFGFNLNVDASSVKITNISNGFTLGSGAVATEGSGFGTFDYFINAPGTDTDAKATSFTFYLSSSNGGQISYSTFVPNTQGYYFVADIGVGSNAKLSGGKAGPIPALTLVPEPTYMTILGAVLISFGLLRKRKGVGGELSQGK